MGESRMSAGHEKVRPEAVRPVLGYAQSFGTVEASLQADGVAVLDATPDPLSPVPRHTHEVAHFVFVMGGLYLTTARNAPPVCTGPAVVYNPPDTSHRDRFERSSGRIRGRFLSISVKRALFADGPESVALERDPYCLSTPAAIAFANQIKEVLRARPRNAPARIASLTVELLATAADVDGGRVAAGPRWLRTAREMIRDRCSGPLTMSDVAEACGVHPVHLARVFRREIGCSPSAYLRLSRLERSAALLEDGGRSLAEVALDSGFADQSHFTKAFTRHYALPPGRYQRLVGTTRAAPADGGEGAFPDRRPGWAQTRRVRRR